MRVLLTLAGFVFMQTAFGQKVVDVTNVTHSLGASAFYTVGGTPFVTEKYVKLVDGTPYFSNDWLQGVLVSEGGHEYKDKNLKLDLFGNEVHYQGENGEEMIATTTIKEIVLTDKEGSNFRFVHSSFLPKTATPMEKGWYQWLGSGTVGLYKFYSKKMTESKPYNSSVVEQRIVTREKYFVLANNAFLEIKKLKDAPSVLANKKAELEEFLDKKDDKNSSTDDRYLALINYYNTLLKEQK